MSITLVKSTDTSATVSAFPWLNTRQWINTVKLYSHLIQTQGDVTGGNLYDGLADNNLNTLRATLPALANVPDHKGSSTTEASPVDYSDGYGHEYAVGE